MNDDAARLGQSVRFSHHRPTRARVDEILSRGDRNAFLGLLRLIAADPTGEVAEHARTLYAQRGRDPEASKSHYAAAMWLAEAMRQFPIERGRDDPEIDR